MNRTTPFACLSGLGKIFSRGRAKQNFVWQSLKGILAFSILCEPIVRNGWHTKFWRGSGYWKLLLVVFQGPNLAAIIITVLCASF